MTNKGQGATEAASSFDVGSVIAAFSEEQIERIIGLSKTRLRYWAKTDFFRPSMAGENPRLPYSRFYSFRDLVALRTLEMLRVQNAVPLQHLRKVAEKLVHLKADLWVRTTLFVINRRVAIVNPETGRPKEVLSDQYVLGVPLAKVIDDTRKDIIKFQHRPAKTDGKITKNRGIAHNKPIVAGTRIPVASIIRLQEDGYSNEKIIEEYPVLTDADIEAALSHKGRVAA